ncbi:MAG TPA: adenylate/guanylate cyclase domain-containing protein [Flavisolibacter sp.]|jgi:adenylate cyclase|nr:adenylate/guanylate cyclase domain-containing protein [Flavisolibacter sp.]
MRFKKAFLYRLYLVTVIAIIWVLFSILMLYNIVEVDKELLRTRRLSYFSLAFAIIGFIVAGAEAFYLKNAFRRFPLWLSTILRMTLTFFLFLAVSLLFLAIYFVFRYNGTFAAFRDVYIEKIIYTPSFLVFMIDLGVLSFLSIMILEISDKYGPGGIRNLLRGRYNKPRQENRIFLFLDINDSTAIAERLGHERYFNMLKDFFADITDPILENNGSIYQYVGDEVSISWQNTPENKFRCLHFVKQAVDAIERREEYYLQTYGFMPRFKTGIHAGEVTAGYIGIIKKELVFSGDTLNTTARIRSKCNELGFSYVMTNDFLGGLQHTNGFVIREIGETGFRGREEKEQLFSLHFQ